MEEGGVALPQGLEQVVDGLLEGHGICGVEDVVTESSNLALTFGLVEVGIEELRLDQLRDPLEDLLATVAVRCHGSRFSAPQAIGCEPSPTMVNPAQ